MWPKDLWRLRTFPKRSPLPKPHEALGGLPVDLGEKLRLLEELLDAREHMALSLGILDARVQFVLASICGTTNDLQPVAQYQETDGIPRALVDLHQSRVGQLHWANDLASHFKPPNASPGNVNDLRWGTGALIDEDLFLTAGHCLEDGHGWKFPSRKKVPIAPADVIKHMRVKFMYQLDAAGNPLPEKEFTIVALEEHRNSKVDYAILRLGADGNGDLPGKKYGAIPVAKKDIAAHAPFCLIQHPNGGRKMVETGTVFANSGVIVTYDDADTDSGASGSPLISLNGALVGIHTDGGCLPSGSGANSGCAIGELRRVSKIIAAL